MQDYFCGWYFKCQSDDQTLALIAASHRNDGRRSNSIQILTEGTSATAFFPYSALKSEPNGFSIGESCFGKSGIDLHINDSNVTAHGRLVFGPFTPIKYDVMGPFRYLPFMECRHSVKSMSHTVCGEITVNGKCYDLGGGRGYIEGDRGRSFPTRYLWTHTFFDTGSLMLSIADIPLGTFDFIGIIGVIHYRGKEYRLATYLGARAVKIGRCTTVRQGKYELTVNLIEQCPLPLAAPLLGQMSRTIHESACCKAEYIFKISDKTVFSFVTDKASFELEYTQSASV